LLDPSNTARFGKAVSLRPSLQHLLGTALKILPFRAVTIWLSGEKYHLLASLPPRKREVRTEDCFAKNSDGVLYVDKLSSQQSSVTLCEVTLGGGVTNSCLYVIWTK